MYRGQWHKDNLDKLDELRYDLKYGITFKNAILYNELTEIIDFVQMKCGELENRVGMLREIINNAFSEAIGKPGVSGNAEYIIYVAEKLIEVYKSVHEWSLEFRSIMVPDEFQNLQLCVSQFSQTVIEDIENLILDYDTRINEAILGIDENSEKRTLSFSLMLRAFDISKYEAEIKNLRDMLL